MQSSSSAFQAVVGTVLSLLHVANPLKQVLPPCPTGRDNNNTDSKDILPSQALSEADFPDVKFWTLQSWRTHLREKKGFSDPDSTDGKAYLEDKNRTSLGDRHIAFV